MLFVCLGNICRSPLAEGILKTKLINEGLAEIIEVDSCGTSRYHIGEPPDPRTRVNALENGVTLNHQARQFSKKDFTHYDHILVMDRSNLKDVKALDDAGTYADKIKLMRVYDPLDKDADVPDPYFGGTDGFQNVFDILNRSVDGLIKALKKDL